MESFKFLYKTVSPKFQITQMILLKGVLSRFCFQFYAKVIT